MVGVDTLLSGIGIVRAFSEAATEIRRLHAARKPVLVGNVVNVCFPADDRHLFHRIDRRASDATYGRRPYRLVAVVVPLVGGATPFRIEKFFRVADDAQLTPKPGVVLAVLDFD